MTNLTAVNLRSEEIPTLVIPVCEDGEIHRQRTLAALVRKAISLPEFSGKKDEELVLYSPRGTKASRVIFLGMGPLRRLDGEALRCVAGRVVGKAMQQHLTGVLIAVPDTQKTGLDRETLIQALLEGAFLANHVFSPYKQDPGTAPLERIELLVGPEEVSRYASLSRRVKTVCDATLLARTWVNLPSNDKRPSQLASLIAQEADRSGLSVSVLEMEALKEARLEALLAVAQGSVSPPCLVLLDYTPPKPHGTIALVGKGVTFDAGGINLKPADGLAHMKDDMAGAAAVAATMFAVAGLGLTHRIVAALPLVENMPSGNATRPGDIVRTHAGKTVEIGNTDAEGRLILADAISYVIETFRPGMLIDLATLTGACVVALGEKIAGVFASDENLAGHILAGAAKTHERCWRMPLPEDYRELLKSDFADINNMSSTRYGGAITAALFLSSFVKNVAWAHIDIAGPSYAQKGSDYCGPGGTGFGVRLLSEVLCRL